MQQTVEQFLVEQLEKIAPGKYTLADVLSLFKAKLRFRCDHLKGGGYLSKRPVGPGKDYNLSIFTFPTGVTEIKCLYNCGLKIRSDQTELVDAFNELYDYPTTNHPAKAETHLFFKGDKQIPFDPGPTPTYTDEDRRRIRESTDLFWKYIERGLEMGTIKPGDPVLGGVRPHPDPIEAPDTIIERGINEAFTKAKSKPPISKATVVAQDSVPALEPVKSNKKIRKTQSRRKSGK